MRRFCLKLFLPFGYCIFSVQRNQRSGSEKIFPPAPNRHCSGHGAGRFAFYHAKHRKSCEYCAELLLAAIRRGFGSWGNDNFEQCYAVLHDAPQGLTQGAQPIIGFNYGAHRNDRVKQAFRYLIIAAVSYSTVIWCISIFIPQAFVALFTSKAALLKRRFGHCAFIWRARLSLASRLPASKLLSRWGRPKFRWFWLCCARSYC